MELYESHYKQLNELNAAHKDFLINNLNQYFVENFPHVSHITKTLSKGKQNQLKEALTTDKLKHLLEFDIILKQNILISNSGTLKFQDSLIKRIMPLVD